MVTGFKEYTKPLSLFEREVILPIVVKGWKNKIPDKDILNGNKLINDINNYLERNKIIYKVRGKKKIYKLNGSTFRSIIHEIRTRELVVNLIANSKGYFKSTDIDKIKKFIKSCRERANSFNQVADALERYNCL